MFKLGIDWNKEIEFKKWVFLMIIFSWFICGLFIGITLGVIA